MKYDYADICEKYYNKKVLITGHTGFKGTWMTYVLLMAGADVTGYALKPNTDPSMFEMLSLDNLSENFEGKERLRGKLTNVYGDVCDLQLLKETFEKAQPEIVIHMAAQPIVRQSYIDPVNTYNTNVMGTVNVLECCRLTESVKSVINVTTDKVYRNYEREEGYKEGEELCGYDPYSNSKSCSELVTDSYKNSFLNERGIAVTTMRAGNVIGGGDFAKDRIIPDCVRAAQKGEEIIVRNPYSTRPYQHVLEPVMCYLRTAIMQEENTALASSYNIGPEDSDAITTGNIATKFCEIWNSITDGSVCWKNCYDGGPHEATYLKLNCDKIKSDLSWKPVWNIDNTLNKLCAWYKAYVCKENLHIITATQIEEFINA